MQPGNLSHVERSWRKKENWPRKQDELSSPSASLRWWNRIITLSARPVFWAFAKLLVFALEGLVTMGRFLCGRTVIPSGLRPYWSRKKKVPSDRFAGSPHRAAVLCVVKVPEDTWRDACYCAHSTWCSRDGLGMEQVVAWRLHKKKRKSSKIMKRVNKWRGDW